MVQEGRQVDYGLLAETLLFAIAHSREFTGGTRILVRGHRCTA